VSLYHNDVIINGARKMTVDDVALASVERVGGRMRIEEFAPQKMGSVSPQLTQTPPMHNQQRLQLQKGGDRRRVEEQSPQWQRFNRALEVSVVGVSGEVWVE
jgi:hypothetical protein